MFAKMKINKEIKKCQKNIEQLEKLRYRSQAALVEAILKNESPSDDDVDYFNKYTSQIETFRDRIQELKKQLETE